MSLGLCVFIGCIGLFGVLIGASLMANDEDIGIPIIISGLVFMAFSITACCIYGISDEKVEETLHVPVVSINNIQLIQYDDPDSSLPIVINVNETFKRSFVSGECIAVTIHSKGPYNGIYSRPEETIDMCKDPMCQPPKFIPPRKERNRKYKESNNLYYMDRWAC